MLSKVYSAGLEGVRAFEITIETHHIPSTPHYVLVGLAEGAVKESFSRIVSAVKSSGFSFPGGKLTQNLAPADLRKEGSSFDLPLATGILACDHVISQDRLNHFIILGELALDGQVRSIRGALPIAMGMADFNKSDIIVPKDNAIEAAIPGTARVWGVNTLREAIEVLNGESDLSPITVNVNMLFQQNRYYPFDFSEVKGQEHVKRALEIAAAGGHNVIMVGPPGSGKSMLAKRFPSILPNPTLDEALETTKIHSIAGLLPENCGLLAIRPFRAPHHTISDSALVGGGRYPKPGEVSLAHNGVLFLDEFPEFKKNVLEVMRQPLEDGEVTISRALTSLTYPAKFMLIAAMNPCPCGYYTDPTHSCTCSEGQIQNYLGRISGPLMDRIDIHVDVPAVSFKELQNKQNGETSETIRKRVQKARERQTKRFQGIKNVYCNAHMTTRLIREFAPLNETCNFLLEQASLQLGLSARAFSRIQKVALTIADLEDCDKILPEHVSEAIQYRSLDKTLMF
ncbi:MAG: YifB family Mg chelatase-like AAA ATPase [Candidatus Marinimicrobia bacterium]|nr:YifB family Mg chelatase-like AAA ATPase [Candidatus Neomarinimicrobiota bacterium]